MTLIDLTHPLTTGMPVYPGDPEVLVDEVLTIPTDGCAVRSLHLGTHSGTHVDAPAHVIPDGRTIDRVLPDELLGDAAVIRLPDLTPGQRIDDVTLGEAWGHGFESLPAIVLLATGWDRFWGTGDYLRHPVLTGEAASALVAAGVRVLGVDMASPDGADGLVAHEILLGADRLIIENLRGLTGLPGNVEFTALPLSVAGGDGAPVRAVAKKLTNWTIGEYAFPGRLRDQLIEAILDGEKTTTTSLVEEYLADGEPLPTPGDREVVVSSDGTPNCVLAITDVRVCRLDEVTVEHALGEGEGHESVAEWRRGHESFWNSPDFQGEHPRFVVDDATEVVCTRFEVLARLCGADD
jgi:kynurenine formamidase/uncharacterized protein YhfF